MSRTPVKKNLNDENLGDAESPSPKTIQYHTMEEKLSALEDDNAALRSMLGRQRSPEAVSRSVSVNSVFGVNHPTNASSQRKASEELTKAKHDLKASTEKRRGLEAMIARDKGDNDALLLRKDQEMRKLQTELQSARSDLDSTSKRLDESEAVVVVLKKENFRLVGLLKENKVEDKPKSTPDYFSKQSVKSERLKKDVPSSRPFSAVLRSVTPMLQQQRGASPNRSHTPTRSALGKAGPVKRPNGTSSSVASTDGSKQAQPSSTRFTARASTARTSSPNPVVRPVSSSRYSFAPTQRGASVTPQDRKKASHEYKVGSRVEWRTMQGVVRYKGPVVSIGEGRWIGIELAEVGKGEHNGTLNGVRYFSTAAKTAVFVRMVELSPPKDVALRSASTSSRQ